MTLRSSCALGVLALGLTLLGVSVASAGHRDQQAQTAPPPMVPKLVAGYLKAGTAPDSLVIVPPPPAEGSAALARDVEASQAGLKLHGTARWDLATTDADLFSPKAVDTFSCAAGIAIGAAETPRLNQLMRRSLTDLALSTGASKRKYMRPRPFTVNKQAICTPADEAVLRSDGSYPSGHSAIGYGWGLILAEVLPDRAAQLVARGRAFADSRRVCNVHWLSDTEEGRVMGSAIVARLHADPAFTADLEAAKAEARAAAAAGKGPTRDCAKEAAALAL